MSGQDGDNDVEPAQDEEPANGEAPPAIGGDDGMPPWGNSDGVDGEEMPPPDFDQASGGSGERGCMAERKKGAFMTKTTGPVTRQQLIEYINLQRWAREGCQTFIFVSLFWFSFLLLVNVHAHVRASYEVYRDVTKAVYEMTASAERGIAPNAIFSAAGESMCSCACPAICTQSFPGPIAQPGVPANALQFNGTVMPEQLQVMRSKASWLKGLGHPVKTMKLEEVNSIADVWFWLQHGMIPELWHEELRSSPVDTRQLFSTAAQLKTAKASLPTIDQPGHFLRWNQVIGGVRLRQRRLHQSDCRAGKLGDRFHQICHKVQESVAPFGPGKIAYAKGFVPDEQVRGAFDVYLDVERPIYLPLELLQFFLEHHHWLDQSTAELQVQVPVINLEVTPALYGFLEVSFKFTRSGDLMKKVDFWTVAAAPYFKFQFVFMADVIWLSLLAYLFFKKIIQAIRYKTRAKQRHDVLCNFWYLADWATIVCGFLIVGSWLFILFETDRVSEDIEAFPKVPAFDASESETDAYHKAYGSVLDDIRYITHYRERLRLADFGYVMMVIFQFIKAFRGNPKMAQLTRTLVDATEDLTHWLACFLVLFLTFAFTGHLVFGQRLEEWSTSTKCVNSAFKALRGDVELGDMYEIAPVTTMCWFGLFLVLMIFIMLNLLLATVYDHYQLIKTKANSSTGVLLQNKDMLKDLWAREGIAMLCCSCCCRCRRGSRYPKHEDLLEGMMQKAGYNAKERHHVFRTVLGPKWMRKKTEKHVFAGEVSAEHIKNDEQMPAEEDLKDLGVAPSYIASLLAGTDNYRNREFDPVEIETNQLRELVTLAEVEMAAMRRRLDNCQGHMRLTMHDLVRRLAGVEKLVHNSLGDLVFLAGAAGVADRTEHEAQMEQFDVNRAGPQKTLALTQTYRRVMTHLGQGTLAKLHNSRKKHQSDISNSVRIRMQNDTYGRIHNDARLADAFGPQERKATARKYDMARDKEGVRSEI